MEPELNSCRSFLTAVEVSVRRSLDGDMMWEVRSEVEWKKKKQSDFT